MVAAGFTGGQAEELRRAMGFKRSERRMKQIEVQLRDGMAQRGITGDAAEQIITSIASFALYGFPESHAASFALLAYASAYLKVHYPAAFYTALLNNQPMGFYHPSTLVKDAQRRGVRFHPIDVQVSGLGLHGRGRRRHPARAPLCEWLARTGRPRDAVQSREHAAASLEPPVAAPGFSLSLRNGLSRNAAATMNRCSNGPTTAGCFATSARITRRRDRLGAPERQRRERRPFHLGRRSRGAHRAAPRRAGHAGRHRRAQLVRLRPAIGAVAGRAGGAALAASCSRRSTQSAQSHAEDVLTRISLRTRATSALNCRRRAAVP